MIVLPAGNASGWTGATGTNTYLVAGRIPTLIDAGVGRAEHVEAVAHALGGESLALVLITHGHIDHAGGVPAIRARWPLVRVRQMLAGNDPLRPGERIHAGSGALTVVSTPGHSPDHCCFLCEDTQDLYCGDLVRTGGTIVIPASRGGDLQQYLDSLRRIRDLHPARLLPGHGPVIEHPEEVIDAYLRHRAEREAQILEALGTWQRTSEEIVPQVYGNLPDALRPAAAESVLAHLVKLEREGRVGRTGDRWRQTG